MTKLIGWTLLVLCGAGAARGAATAAAPPAPTPATVMKDLERNASLGEALTHRQGSPDELALMQKLADRGSAEARALVAQDPNSAEAQYLLGSWLLYGYRAVERESVTFDTSGGEHREKTRVTIRGLADSPVDGLKALASAHTLAPGNGRYFVDYGAALYDYDLPDEAMSVLKKVWLSPAKLTSQDKLRTALLMSDLLADQGDVSSAREWVYRALLLDPKNAELVPRLRNLDRLQAEILASPPAVAEPGSVPPGTGEEAAPSDEGTPQETGPEVDQGASEGESAPPPGEGTSSGDGRATQDGEDGG